MENLIKAEIGVRFNPTDKEVIEEFLLKKLRGIPLGINPIIECNVYDKQSNQWRIMLEKTVEKKLWFYSKITKKTENGEHVDRVTRCGTWKGQTDKPIYKNEKNPDELDRIGSKRTFSFVPMTELNMNTSTRFVMHEYRLEGLMLAQVQRNDHVICMIKKMENKKEGEELRLQREREREMEINEINSIIDEAMAMAMAMAAFQTQQQHPHIDFMYDMDPFLYGRFW